MRMLIDMMILAIVGVLDEFFPIDIYAAKLKMLQDRAGQSCMEEREVESSRHFLLHCLAFAILRLKHFFGKIEDIVKTDNSRLN